MGCAHLGVTTIRSPVTVARASRPLLLLGYRTTRARRPRYYGGSVQMHTNGLVCECLSLLLVATVGSAKNRSGEGDLTLPAL